jgi:hypothetical protein
MYLTVLAAAVAHGYVLPAAASNSLSQSPINPGNFLEVPSRSTGLAIGARGDLAGVSWRMRVERTSMQTNGDSDAEADWRLQELSKTFALGERTSLIVGKRVISWDVSLSSTPLGFFQRMPNLTDVADRSEQAEGLPLVALAYVGPRMDVTWVYSDDTLHDDNRGNRGLRQAAVNLTRTWGRGSYSAILQKPFGQAIGTGVAASITASDSVTLQMSGIVRGAQARWVAGAVWAPSPATNIVLEWSRDDSAALANVGVEGQWLMPSTKRDYAFVRVAGSVWGMGASLVTRTNLDDGSTFSSLSVDRTFGTNVLAGITASRYFASAGGELSFSPVRSTVEVWCKYAFAVGPN